jgi:hypothetical protein
MLIATSLAAAGLLCAPAWISSPLPATPPTVTVTVAVAAALSPTLVAGVLNEAGNIWRTAGFVVIWERRDDTPATAMAAPGAPASSRGPAPRDRSSIVSDDSRDSAVSPVRTSGLHVTIGNERGGVNKKDPNLLPLGWIVFEADAPLQEIYLSSANATALLIASEGVVGRMTTMTIVERDRLLSRAMGRALAHEIGHYLLASKTHAASGLMQARRGSAELFGSSRDGFRVLADQRRLVSDRLRSSGHVALWGGDSDR